MTDVVPAVISGVVALVVSAIGIFAASKRFQHELTLQEERLKVELRTTFMAEEAIHELLLDESFRHGRSFEQIKRHVGGFEDDELRKLLVRSGAIRYYRERDNKEIEMWGIRSRVLAQVYPKPSSRTETP